MVGSIGLGMWMGMRWEMLIPKASPDNKILKISGSWMEMAEDRGGGLPPCPPAATARGGENAAAAAGRAEHKELAKRIADKAGWKSALRLVGADGNIYKPDVVTRGGHIFELKPNTSSGRAKGASQIRNYEEQLGMRGRVIYYEPKP